MDENTPPVETTRRIRLTVHAFHDWPEEYKTEKLTAGETVADTLKDPLAYVETDQDRTEHAHLRAIARPSAVAHEIEHACDDSFGNEQHHRLSWRHPLPCIRSYSPIRFWFHNRIPRKTTLALIKYRSIEVDLGTGAPVGPL